MAWELGVTEIDTPEAELVDYLVWMSYRNESCAVVDKRTAKPRPLRAEMQGAKDGRTLRARAYQKETQASVDMRRVVGRAKRSDSQMVADARWMRPKAARSETQAMADARWAKLKAVRAEAQALLDGFARRWTAFFVRSEAQATADVRKVKPRTTKSEAQATADVVSGLWVALLVLVESAKWSDARRALVLLSRRAETVNSADGRMVRGAFPKQETQATADARRLRARLQWAEALASGDIRVTKWRAIRLETQSLAAGFGASVRLLRAETQALADALSRWWTAFFARSESVTWGDRLQGFVRLSARSESVDSADYRTTKARAYRVEFQAWADVRRARALTKQAETLAFVDARKVKPRTVWAEAQTLVDGLGAFPRLVRSEILAPYGHFSRLWSVSLALPEFQAWSDWLKRSPHSVWAEIQTANDGRSVAAAPLWIESQDIGDGRKVKSGPRLAESWAVADAWGRLWEARLAFVEALGSVGGLTRKLKAIRLESQGMVDGFERLWAAFVARLESVAWSDSRKVRLGALCLESVSWADVLRKAMALTRWEAWFGGWLLGETMLDEPETQLGAEDGFDRITFVPGRIFGESLSLGDARAVLARAVRVEAQAMGDAISRFWQGYRALLESLSAAAGWDLRSGLLKAESVDSSDAVIKRAGVSWVEMAIAADGFSRLWQALRSVAESQAVADAIERAASMVRAAAVGAVDWASCAAKVVRLDTAVLTDGVRHGMRITRVEAWTVAVSLRSKAGVRLSALVAFADRCLWSQGRRMAEIVGVTDGLAKAALLGFAEWQSMAEARWLMMRQWRAEAVRVHDAFGRKWQVFRSFSDSAQVGFVMLWCAAFRLGIVDELRWYDRRIGRRWSGQRAYSEAVEFGDLPIRRRARIRKAEAQTIGDAIRKRAALAFWQGYWILRDSVGPFGVQKRMPMEWQAVAERRAMRAQHRLADVQTLGDALAPVKRLARLLADALTVTGAFARVWSARIVAWEAQKIWARIGGGASALSLSESWRAYDQALRMRWEARRVFRGALTPYDSERAAVGLRVFSGTVLSDVVRCATGKSLRDAGRVAAAQRFSARVVRWDAVMIGDEIRKVPDAVLAGVVYATDELTRGVGMVRAECFRALDTFGMLLGLRVLRSEMLLLLDQRRTLAAMQMAGAVRVTDLRAMKARGMLLDALGVAAVLRRREGKRIVAATRLADGRSMGVTKRQWERQALVAGVGRSWSALRVYVESVTLGDRRRTMGRLARSEAMMLGEATWRQARLCFGAAVALGDLRMIWKPWRERILRGRALWATVFEGSGWQAHFGRALWAMAAEGLGWRAAIRAAAAELRVDSVRWALKTRWEGLKVLSMLDGEAKRLRVWADSADGEPFVIEAASVRVRNQATGAVMIENDPATVVGQAVEWIFQPPSAGQYVVEFTIRVGLQKLIHRETVKVTA